MVDERTEKFTTDWRRVLITEQNLYKLEDFLNVLIVNSS